MHPLKRLSFPILGATFAVTAAAPARATEEPAYRSLERAGDLEVRLYAPMIVAETSVGGDMDRASRSGFRLLADYIFGGNRGRSGDSARIAMTAPVAMEAEEGGWRVHFVMPSAHSMGSLPEPANPRVRLREVPAQKVVALGFSGLAGEAKVQAKTQEVLAWIQSRGLEPAAPPQLARYNPPWTLPPFRRNEILVPVR